MAKCSKIQSKRGGKALFMACGVASRQRWPTETKNYEKKTWVGSSLAQCAGAVGGEKGGVDESTPAGLGQELDMGLTRRQGAADLIAPRIPPGRD